MGARGWLNLALALVVAALAAALWYGGREPPEPPKPRLLDLDRGKVARIEIERPGRDTIVLARRDGRWWLERPFAVHASAFRAESVLGLATAESEARFEAGAGELAKYGLDPPRAVVRFDGRPVAVGDSEPIDLRRYVRVGEERTVHLVRDTFYGDVAADAAELAGTELLPPGWDPVEITLPGLILRRDTDGRWRAEPASALDGRSADALTTLVEAWRGARALWVERPDEATRAALESAPLVRVRLRAAVAGKAAGDGEEAAEPPSSGGAANAKGKAAATLELRFRVLERENDRAFVREDVGLAWRVTAARAKELLELPPPEKTGPAEADGKTDRGSDEADRDEGGSGAGAD